MVSSIKFNYINVWGFRRAGCLKIGSLVDKNNLILDIQAGLPKGHEKPKNIEREMVAFANATGGTILIGVNDNLAAPSGAFCPEKIKKSNSYIKHVLLA